MTFSIERRAPRFNCHVCGSFVRMPDEIEDGARDYTFECPRCASVYAVASASRSVVVLELAVAQHEYDRSRRGQARQKPKRDAIYADPIFGPIRRAEDRIHAAERELALLMAQAHLREKKSIREIADHSRSFGKSRVHEIVKDAAERFSLAPAGPNTDGMGDLDWDDIPF